MFRVSDIILEELGFEFIPHNRIGLSPVHDSDLGFFEPRILEQPGGWNAGLERQRPAIRWTTRFVNQAESYQFPYLSLMAKSSPTALVFIPRQFAVVPGAPQGEE